MASSIKGLEALIGKLNGASSKLVQEIKEVIELNVGDMHDEIVRNAPGPSDEIATQYGTENERDIVNGRGWTPISQAITYEIYPNGLGGRVIANDSAGPILIWIEMGTGQSAKQYLLGVPKEWRALAQRYYLTGTGTILARPFFLPAFNKYSIQALKEFKQAMKNFKL